MCPRATEMKRRLQSWDLRNARLRLELHVARVVGDPESLVHRDQTLIDAADERLIEGLHPVVLALLNDAVQLLRAGRLEDEVANAPRRDERLHDRDARAAVDRRDEALSNYATECAGEHEARLLLHVW